jgi:type I restriction enzyme S subunit
MAGEWREYTFADLISSRALEIGDGYRAKNSELGGDGPIFLRAGHVRDTHIDLAGVDRFRSALARAVAPKMSQSRDVIVTTKGNSTGRTSYVNDSLPPVVYSPHLSYWRSLDVEVIEPGFLRYWSRSQHFQDQLAGLAASTDMAPYLSLVDQKRLRITLPSTGEQRAIAHILGTLDDKIELNRRMNDTLEAIARALFKSWFVDFDPVRAKAEGRDSGLPKPFGDLFPDSFEDSELGDIPEGWRVCGLDEIATYLNGLALQKYPADDGGFLPVIKIAELRAGHSKGAGRASADIPPAYVVEDGDVLFSWSGSLEVEVWCGGSGALNQHLFKVTSDRFPKWFYLLWTRHHLPDFRSIAAGKATTMGHIQRGHLSAAKALVPPTPLLEEMTRTFEPLVDGLIAMRLQSRTLAELRDSLLPKLISGEVRVLEAQRLGAVAGA